MGLLYTHRDLPFTLVRDHLDLSDGNLASHAKRLEAANHLEARKVLTRDGFEVRYRITRTGSEAFREYVRRLRAFLDATDEAATPGTGAAEP